MAVATWARVVVFLWLFGLAGIRLLGGTGFGGGEIVLLILVAALVPGALDSVVAIVRELWRRPPPLA